MSSTTPIRWISHGLKKTHRSRLVIVTPNMTNLERKWWIPLELQWWWHHIILSYILYNQYESNHMHSAVMYVFVKVWVHTINVHFFKFKVKIISKFSLEGEGKRMWRTTCILQDQSEFHGIFILHVINYTLNEWIEKNGDHSNNPPSTSKLIQTFLEILESSSEHKFRHERNYFLLLFSFLQLQFM